MVASVKALFALIRELVAIIWLYAVVLAHPTFGLVPQFFNPVIYQLALLTGHEPAVFGHPSYLLSCLRRLLAISDLSVM